MKRFSNIYQLFEGGGGDGGNGGGCGSGREVTVEEGDDGAEGEEEWRCSVNKNMDF